MFLFHYNDLSPLKILVFILSCHVSLFLRNNLSQLSFDHDQMITEINRFVEKGTHDMITFFLSRSLFTKTAYLNWSSWLWFYHVTCSFFTKTIYLSWKPYLPFYHVTCSLFTKTIYLVENLIYHFTMWRVPFSPKRLIYRNIHWKPKRALACFIAQAPMPSPASHKPHTYIYVTRRWYTGTRITRSTELRRSLEDIPSTGRADRKKHWNHPASSGRNIDACSLSTKLWIRKTAVQDQQRAKASARLTDDSYFTDSIHTLFCFCRVKPVGKSASWRIFE